MWVCFLYVCVYVARLGSRIKIKMYVCKYACMCVCSETWQQDQDQDVCMHVYKQDTRGSPNEIPFHPRSQASNFSLL